MNHTITDVIQALSFYLYVLDLYTHTFHIFASEDLSHVLKKSNAITDFLFLFSSESSNHSL